MRACAVHLRWGKGNADWFLGGLVAAGASGLRRGVHNCTVTLVGRVRKETDTCVHARICMRATRPGLNFRNIKFDFRAKKAEKKGRVKTAPFAAGLRALSPLLPIKILRLRHLVLPERGCCVTKYCLLISHVQTFILGILFSERLLFWLKSG